MDRTKRLQDRRMKKFKDVFGRWKEKKLSGAEAAQLLGMSERTFRRYRHRYEEEGMAGLADGRLGKASPKRVAVTQIEWMLEQYRRHYTGWTVKHFHEHLQKRHNFNWGYTWTKTELQLAGLIDRAKLRGAHRRKRPRKPCEGMMLHQDASRFAWLADQNELDLVVTMDDATNKIYSAILVEEEGTISTFQALLEVFTCEGLPASLYTDRGSHYFWTPKTGEAVDKERLTQVGRALRQLGVEHIPAYSPQARGRSERTFGTLQDRLPKELALAGIKTVDDANRYIRDVYLPEHNARFARPAELPESAFVRIGDVRTLIECLCVEVERVVGRDNTVAFEGLKLQLPESPLRAHFVRANVRVRIYPDATLAVFYGPRCLARYTPAGDLVSPQQDRLAA